MMKKMLIPINFTLMLLLMMVILTACLEQPPEQAENTRRAAEEATSAAIDLALDIPESTNNEVLNIPGKIGPGLRVFINESEVEQDPFGNFTAQVRLSPGQNYIPVRVVSNDGKDIYATTKTVNFGSSANPRLDTVLPATYYSKTAKMIITGVTDPDCIIRANGYPATPDERGNFIVEVPLDEGDNIVKVVSTSPKGKTSTVQQVVNYSVAKDMQPLLVVSSPDPSKDGYISTERIKIIGFTNPYNLVEIYNNYYNGDNAVKSLIFKGATNNGQFSADVTLSTAGNGVNDLQIVVTNENGGTASETRRVTYKALPVEEEY